MSVIFVTNRGGQELTLSAQNGRSVMETIRDGGIDELLAMCGGGCSCATCHVYVHPDFLENLMPMADDENELLDSSKYRAYNSRLSCQIQLTPQLDGLKITIADQE